MNKDTMNKGINKEKEDRRRCQSTLLGIITRRRVGGTSPKMKIGINRPLMRKVHDKLDECEGRLSELLIDSATDESEANSPIKMTPQEDKGEVVYLSRTRKGTMRSKWVIDKINEMKMQLGSKVIPRRAGKTKVDSEISIKAVNSAKRKRVGEDMDLRQGDDRLPGRM